MKKWKKVVMKTRENPGLEKILEQTMMENSGYRAPSVGVEFNEQASSGYSKRMRVWGVKSVLKRLPVGLLACLSASLCVLSRVFLDVLH